MLTSNKRLRTPSVLPLAAVFGQNSRGNWGNMLARARPRTHARAGKQNRCRNVGFLIVAIHPARYGRRTHGPAARERATSTLKSHPLLATSMPSWTQGSCKRPPFDTRPRPARRAESGSGAPGPVLTPPSRLRRPVCPRASTSKSCTVIILIRILSVLFFFLKLSDFGTSRERPPIELIVCSLAKPERHCRPE